MPIAYLNKHTPSSSRHPCSAGAKHDPHNSPPPPPPRAPGGKIHEHVGKPISRSFSLLFRGEPGQNPLSTIPFRVLWGCSPSRSSPPLNKPHQTEIFKGRGEGEGEQEKKAAARSDRWLVWRHPPWCSRVRTRNGRGAGPQINLFAVSLGVRMFFLLLSISFCPWLPVAVYAC